MKKEITRELLRDVRPAQNAIDIADTKLPGFGVRVMPSGTIHYNIRYTDGNGKRCRYSLKRTFPTTNVSDAREQARIELGRIAAGHNPSEERKEKRRGKLTLFDFIEENYSPHLETTTKSGAVTIVRLKKCFAQFKDKPLVEFDDMTLERWRSSKMKAGATASTVNRDIAALKSALSRAVKWKLLATNPIREFKAIKTDIDPIVRYLSEEEEGRLRKAMDEREERERKGRANANKWRAERGYELMQDLDELHYVDYLKPAVLLSMNTGVRQGELLSLTWKNVHLGQHPYIFIPAKSSKSRKGRHIPLNDEAFDVLNRWKEQRPTSSELVFPNAHGVQISEVKTAWKRLLQQAEITDFRWHDMRHHFASWLVMKGVDLNTVRELLGHADMQMTQRYAHLSPKHKADAVQKLMGKRHD